MMRSTYAPIVLLLLLVSFGSAQTLDFEDLALGAMYDPPAGPDPDSFVTNGVTVNVLDFVFSSGTSFGGGFTEVENSGLAGGSGNELEVNNVNLGFDFGGPVQTVGIVFGEYGGNINFEVNGDFHNVQNFQDLPAIIGGATYNVTPGSGAGSTMTIQGLINSISIGGQELWIDDVRYVVPEPAGLGWLAIGLFAVLRRLR